MNDQNGFALLQSDVRGAVECVANIVVARRDSGSAQDIGIGQFVVAGMMAFERLAAAVIGAPIVSCVFVRAADKKYNGG